MIQIKTLFSKNYAEWSALQQNTTIAITTKCVFFCIILMAGIIGYAWNKLPPTVPLWFSRPWGNERLAPFQWLLILPIGTLCWYIINMICSIHITKDHLVFSQMLSVGACIIALFSLIAVSMIVWITI